MNLSPGTRLGPHRWRPITTVERERARGLLRGTPSGEIMRVPLTFSGGTVRPAVAQLIMKAPSLFSHSGFVLDRAGSRILSLATSPTTMTAPLTVTLNWPALLRTQGNPTSPQ